MQQCHFCKGFFPIDQLSTIEGYFPDGRVRHVSWSCDLCLNGVFSPADLTDDPDFDRGTETMDFGSGNIFEQ